MTLENSLRSFAPNLRSFISKIKMYKLLSN
nr:MAG TPA: hypothetical protein [Caudoviricetes sp.]